MPAVGPVQDAIFGARDRLSRLAVTLQGEVFPRLLRSHRSISQPDLKPPVTEEVEAFAATLVDGDEAALLAMIEGLRARGLPMASIYLDLLAPAARHLGEMWAQDCADFTAVTIGVGRLHRLLRQLAPAFGSEVDHPPTGRRILLAQPDGETHVFGLSMLAEFFRREGWDVVGGIAGTGIDPVACARDDWFDVAGFSVGSELLLPWLRDRIAATREASRNPALVVMVGGPLFTLYPEWALEVGADATADADSAPRMAEKMLGKRLVGQAARASAR